MSKEKEKSFDNATADCVLVVAQDCRNTANGICNLIEHISSYFYIEEYGNGTSLSEQLVKNVLDYLSVVKSSCKGIKRDTEKIYALLDEDIPAEDIIDN